MWLAGIYMCADVMFGFFLVFFRSFLESAVINWLGGLGGLGGWRWWSVSSLRGVVA
jgi:hypothetical protein